ncbi:hypothetical protein AAP_03295 [Ascosphaera apis ARSEF 7405]|uniref:Uncharacterized protein n=1 Tax=Ascosphaera apis ARSEF 7405 TaxID=392613 RepID=A0A167YP93_9EURO|nr:hypothetical protein AAP_03295 [Ascosphaera apis ARSEF 7405]
MPAGQKREASWSPSQAVAKRRNMTVQTSVRARYKQPVKDMRKALDAASEVLKKSAVINFAAIVSDTHTARAHATALLNYLDVREEADGLELALRKNINGLSALVGSLSPR